jgi:hypothetical protein
MPQLFDRMISSGPSSDSAHRPDTLKIGTAPDELDVERDPYGTSTGMIDATDITEEIRKNWKESLFRIGNPDDPIRTAYSFDQFIIIASERQRLASLVKNTSLSTAYINQFISKSQKSIVLIEKIARSRTNGVMQSTLNQIDLTKLNSSLPNSSSFDDFEDSGIKKSKSHVQYLIDPMVKIGLIAKQPYSYRIGNKPKHQILLTLNRFYRD